MLIFAIFHTLSIPGNPRPPCTPDDIEKLHISLVRKYATIPDDRNLLRPDKPEVVGNRFSGVEVLVQWKDGYVQSTACT
jgi:hypothetical protein